MENFVGEIVDIEFVSDNAVIVNIVGAYGCEIRVSNIYNLIPLLPIAKHTNRISMKKLIGQLVGVIVEGNIANGLYDVIYPNEVVYKAGYINNECEEDIK